VVYITSSVQEGLPMVATPYMELLIEGILAAAQELYPVTICGYCFMANHFHILLVVQNPENVYKFIGYLKGELAHAINLLLGRNQRSVWMAGYDSPTVLDYKKAWDSQRYILLNPVKANLVERCSQFPGVTSYQALLAGGMTKKCRRVARHAIPQLPEKTLSLREQREFARHLRDSSGNTHTLTVEPWAFLRCFEYGDTLNESDQLKRLLKELSEDEDRYAKARIKPVIGAHALILGDMRTPYSSKKTGKKMICLSAVIELRKRYISWFKDKRDHARQVYHDYRAGKGPMAPPPGFFTPGGALVANIFAPFFLGILF
jgi:REP element-mobilizing transposase RayT